MKKIAVLIPCYNEEKTIVQVIKDAKENIPEAVIYVYDNNSTDATAVLAKEAGAVVVKAPKQGKGNVIIQMFKEIDADIYLMTDGDNTYPLDNAKDMITAVEEGADMVIGDRLSSTYYTENKRPFHNFGNDLVKDVIRWLFQTEISDVMTGYRAFSRSFVKYIPLSSKGFQIETEMTIKAIHFGMKLKSIPVQYRDRPEGSVSKLNTFSDGFKVLTKILELYICYTLHIPVK